MLKKKNKATLYLKLRLENVVKPLIV